MAVAANPPITGVKLDHPRPHFSKLKELDFSLSRKPHKFFLIKSQLNNNSTFGSSPSSTDPIAHLSHLCLQSQLDQALSFLISRKDIHQDIEEHIFVSLIKLCEFQRASKHGSLVCSLVLKLMSQLSLRLGNSLLSMLVKLRNLGDAWYVFGKMHERDVFSWNVLIGGYSKNGYFEEALDLYNRMLWVGGGRPDVYTLTCVLSICGRIPDLNMGRHIHAHVARFGIFSNIDVVNAMISMYMKCGEIAPARKLFDEMPLRDTISWNATISGYFENMEYSEGLTLFFLMRESGFCPDLVTLTSVISACKVVCDVRLGMSLHGYVAKTEYKEELSLYNSLIQLYSSIGNLGESLKIFGRVKKHKDVVTWTTMISAYQKNGLPEMAIETYEKMQVDGVVPDEVTMVPVITACASLGLLEMGIKLNEIAEGMGFVKYVTVSNTLIYLYSKCGDIDKALQVFHQIPTKDVISWTSIIWGLHINNRDLEALVFFRQMKDPNPVTLISSLSACSGMGALMSGKEIHGYVMRNGVDFDGFLPNALLNLYIRCGKTGPAMNLFNNNLQRAHDISAWNIMLTGYARFGKGRPAVELFSRMVDSNIKPDEITFLSLLCACSRTGMVSEGLEYFKNMESEFVVKPNLKHYACVVDLLGRAGKLEEAYDFIQRMSVMPDSAIWGALLNSCRTHKNLKLGEIAAKHILEADELNFGYYTLLSRLYTDFEKCDEVIKLKKLMREKGMDFHPGCCWIEVKGKVHAFLSGDISHPQIKEINEVLRSFYDKMKVERNPVDEAKGELFCGHSERLAIAYGLINTLPGMPISVTKNLCTCRGCHDMIKFISMAVRRQICVRDCEGLHCFKDGSCSCGDEGYWGNHDKLN
ncbi:unnamed protein product [Cuscuta epithymum]|uniref:DYW domain-containing protein n=1 Tax=Cuscuta epithymum TaxID=186058 RepID=A0AAV0E002_9ASTE|nr:unnamed protein product [Cuscuta epithymum]